MKLILINVDSKDTYSYIKDIFKNNYIEYLSSEHICITMYEPAFIKSMIIMSQFIKTYKHICEDHFLYSKNDKALVIITDIYKSIIEIYKDIDQNIFHTQVSHLFKSFKMAGCKRPDKFIYFLNDSENIDRNSPEYFITHDLCESDDGDSLILSGTNGLEQLKRLINKYSPVSEEDICEACQISINEGEE